MIKLPVWTMDRARRGVVTWDAGQLAIEAGSLLPVDVKAVHDELTTVHRYRPATIDPTLIDGSEQPFADLQGHDTPELFLFHANYLPTAGYLPGFEDLEHDGELDTED